MIIFSTNNYVTNVNLKKNMKLIIISMTQYKLTPKNLRS